jgi:hypothetical protein
VTDTTPEPTEGSRIDINDAREQLLDILGDETAVCSTDAQGGVLYVIAAEDTATPATWRGYEVVRQYPTPEDQETDEQPNQSGVLSDIDTSQVTGNEGFTDTEHPERAELPESEPYSGNPDDLAIPDLTEQESEAFLAALEERRARPRVIYSTIDDGLGNEQVVGWDTCGKCLHHIRICECADGPHRPSYVEKFAFTPVPERKTYEPGGDMVEGTMHAEAVTYENDDDMVITRVDDERSASGRRKRKDAGKSRGPRDTQATQAAAEDLAAAIKDRSSDG